MPIDLPNLADRTYRELADDMLSAIPKYSSNWTDYNASDPGVALIELFSWVGESLLYQIDNIPYESYVTFLKLFAGLYDEDIESLINEKKSFDKEHVRLLTFLDEVMKKEEAGVKVDIKDMMAAARKFFYSPYRAISGEDFQVLAIEAAINDSSGEREVKRAIVNNYPEAGKVEVIIVPSLDDRYVEALFTEEKLEISATPFDEASHETLKDQVKAYLDDRKLVGTLVDVILPRFTVLSLEISVFCPEFSDTKQLLEKIKDAVTGFLDPVKGGEMGTGRAVDRTLSLYEVAHVVASIEGVKGVNWIKSEDLDFVQKEVSGLLWLQDLSIEVLKEESL